MASFVQVVDQLLICCLSPDKFHKVHQLSTTEALCSSRVAELLVSGISLMAILQRIASSESVKVRPFASEN